MALRSFAAPQRAHSTSAELSEAGNYQIGGDGGWDVLPDAQTRVSKFLQSPVGVGVAPTVRLDLPVPPGGIRVGAYPVIRAAVPEAAIDTDGQFCPREEDVDSLAGESGYCRLNSVPQSSGMKLAAQSDLGLGVCPAEPRKARTHLRHGCSSRRFGHGGTGNLRAGSVRVRLRQ